MAVMTTVSPIPYGVVLLLRDVAAGHPILITYQRRRRIATQNGQPVSMRDVDVAQRWFLVNSDLTQVTEHGQRVLDAHAPKEPPT